MWRNKFVGYWDQREKRCERERDVVRTKEYIYIERERERIHSEKPDNGSGRDGFKAKPTCLSPTLPGLFKPHPGPPGQTRKPQESAREGENWLVVFDQNKRLFAVM
jgi:hypothetical protein